MTLKETMLPNSDEHFFASEILVVISLDFISAKEKTIANIFTEQQKVSEFWHILVNLKKGE